MTLVWDSYKEALTSGSEKEIMWQVIAMGSEGSTYIYEVDAPDYANKATVFDAACRQHGEERRTRKITETLNIRPGSYAVHMLYPQGHPERLDKVLSGAVDKGVYLEAGDIRWEAGQPTIDGMDAHEWLAAI